MLFVLKKLHTITIVRNFKFHYNEPIYLNDSHASSNSILKRKCNSVYVQHGASSLSYCSIYTNIFFYFNRSTINTVCVCACVYISLSFFTLYLYTIHTLARATKTCLSSLRHGSHSNLCKISQQPLSQHNY